MPHWGREVVERSQLAGAAAAHSQLYFVATFWTTFLVALLAIGAQAQRQSTVTPPLLLNSSATGRVIPAPNDLIGAGASYWTYCSNATSLQVIAEESPDNVHFVPVSAIYGPPLALNGVTCGVIQVGGLFGYPAFNVLLISGGTISVWYSGTTGVVSTFPPATNSSGATAPVICDNTTGVTQTAGTTVALASPINRNQKVVICSMTLSFPGATTSTGEFDLLSSPGSCASLVEMWGIDVPTGATNPVPFFVTGSLSGPQGAQVCLRVPAIGVNPLVSYTWAYQ